MTIVFTTINLWYSGFLRYEKELVTTSAETSFFDVRLVMLNGHQLNNVNF